MIYLDNAATTRMSRTAAEKMLPFFTETYGNPSSIYGAGRAAKEAVRNSRDTIAEMLGAKAEEILFTSGGTESDNWALTGAAEAFGQSDIHMITSRIEHPAVLRTCAYLEQVRGVQMTYLDVNADGLVAPEDVIKSIRPNTKLLSVMFANNETGAVQPVAELGRIAHEHGVLFHTDAVQAFGHIPIDVNAMEIDLLSASGHKFHGPKGCGFLYMRKQTGLGAMIRGGAQEFNRRAGTENVPGIVGMGAAAGEAWAEMTVRMRQETALRDYMIQRLLGEIPDALLNGHPQRRLPNNVNVLFRDVSAEALLVMLDLQGICASGGSACSSGSLDPSHVLLAMGRSRAEAFSSVRFTLSHETTREEIDRTVEVLKGAVLRLRDQKD